MAKNITLAIPDELAVEMDKFSEVNWSAVAREAIDNYIRRRSDPSLTPILERFAREKEKLYQEGWKDARQVIHRLSYLQVEKVFEKLGKNHEDFWENITYTMKYYPQDVIISVEPDRPTAYKKGFGDAFVELREKLGK